MKMLASELTACLWEVDDRLDDVARLMRIHFVSPSYVNHAGIVGALWYVVGVYHVLVAAGYMTDALAAPMIDQVEDLIGFVEDFVHDHVGW